MLVRSLIAGAALAVVAGLAVVVHRERRLRRQLTRERATHRLTAASLHRDLDAFQARIDRTLAEPKVLAEADLVLDEALARLTRTDPPTEGGPR